MFTGLAESIEYILTPAVIVFFIGSYMTAIFETPTAAQPLWWVGAYAVFLLLNLRGVELSFRVSVFVTLGALAVLAIYWVSALPHFDFNRWALNIGVGPDGATVELPEGGGSWLPFGIGGALAALPFAVWLFLAIEQLPLAAEESLRPEDRHAEGPDLRHGDADDLGDPDHVPELWCRLDGCRQDARRFFAGEFRRTAARRVPRHLRRPALAKLLAFFAVIGLIASFHTIIYAYGRQIYRCRAPAITCRSCR